MDETLMLVLLALVMLIGSYFAGVIPLVVNLSERKLKVVSIFGAGLLVGTALTVIIPEGIRSIYQDSHSPPPSNAAASPSPANHQSEENSATIGFSLVLGFIFMMIVDQISTRKTREDSPRNSTATIGLVVHAAADGIALGAAATTAHHDVEMIVFLAIMLHKAPAAFGLVTFLLHEGIPRQTIRRHLLVFAIAAPLLTLITYFCIGQEQKETLNSVNATGIAMLFSAGTFLYVATVHVLPELTHGSHGGGGAGHHGGSNLSLEQPMIKAAAAAGAYHGLQNVELLILICGALMPLLLTVGHHH